MWRGLVVLQGQHECLILGFSVRNGLAWPLVSAMWHYGDICCSASSCFGCFPITVELRWEKEKGIY